MSEPIIPESAETVSKAIRMRAEKLVMNIDNGDWDSASGDLFYLKFAIDKLDKEFEESMEQSQ